MRLRRFIGLGLATGLLVGCGGGGGGSSVATTSLKAKVIATGLNVPMQYLASPTDPTLAYVVEQSGRVKVLVNDVVQSTVVIDLTGVVNTAGETGLLGMAFDPGFASNHYIYLHENVGSTLDTHVVRYTMAADGLTASAATAHPVIRITQSDSIHKGGNIRFGADGMLYLAMGDGGPEDDTLNHAQDPTTLLGKIIRIDPSKDDFPLDANNNYGIPASNPFVGTAGVRGEIWDFGVRNPFRWNVDKTTGALIIADVGQDAFEEVDYEPAGKGGRNYGWSVREALSSSGLSNGSAYGSTYQNPFLALPHPSSNCIIGGFIYRGAAMPSLQGQYLMADYIHNKFWSTAIPLDGAGEARNVAFGYLLDYSSSLNLNGPVSIEPDANGEPVVCEYNAGQVSRLVPGP